MFLVRILLLPLKLAAALLVVVFRIGLWLGAVPFRVTGATARLVGFKGTILFGGGVAAGLLLAPGPGRDLRRKLQAKASGGGAPSDDDLAEKVRFELAHAPRTWHLPQPDVTVAGGRVVLSGEISHEDGREELGRVAGAVPGVTAVENRLLVVDLAEELAEAVAEEIAEELAEELAVELVEELAEELAVEIVEEMVAEAVAEEIAEELAEELVEELVAEAVAEEIAEELAEEELAEELAEEGDGDGGSDDD